MRDLPYRGVTPWVFWARVRDLAREEMLEVPTPGEWAAPLLDRELKEWRTALGRELWEALDTLESGEHPLGILHGLSYLERRTTGHE